MGSTNTDCRSTDGKTVGLIDNIINSAHILAERNLKPKEVQEALTDLYNDPELLKIMHGDLFVGKGKPKEIRYKAGTILTDGKGFIRIGYVREKDWTTENNYGRKMDEYVNCTHFPLSKQNDPKGYYLNGEMIYSGMPGHLPGLWLQDGYSLNKFKPICESLIHPDIVSWLKNFTPQEKKIGFKS